MVVLFDNKLKKITRITEEILRHAIEKEWDEVFEKEKDRRKLIERFFDAEYNGKDADTIKNTLARIVSIDKKISSLAELEKLNILEKMRNLSTGRNAVDAYTKNSF